jgi:phosphatidylethanolamine/phosphatidyl-N-methylethanolamine N-methyltransferase
MKLTNAWNKFIYRLWSPVYDPLFDRFFVRGARKRSLAVLNLRGGERVLIPGVGTGVDLPLLPEGVRVLGIDLSAGMLAQARRKLPLAGREIELREGDVQMWMAEPGSFDAAVLHLILSVAPDGAACFRETMRALRPGGRAVIFDKFQPEAGTLGTGRRLFNLFTMLIGTDITRRLGDLTAGTGARIVSDEPSLLGGAYRIVLVEKPEPRDRRGLKDRVGLEDHLGL